MPLLPDEHLQYPLRQPDWAWTTIKRYLVDHAACVPLSTGPNGSAKLAVWIVVSLQWFPLTLTRQPRPPAGAFDDPYPNFRDYSHRDYGNRIGAFRIMEVLNRFGLRATAPVNAAVHAGAYPARWSRKRRGMTGSFLAMVSTWADCTTPNLDQCAEEAMMLMVQTALATVRQTTGQQVTGWLSPGLSESLRTPDLLAANGIDYLCDWVNDELPYPMRTQSGPIWAMPYSDLKSTTQR